MAGAKETVRQKMIGMMYLVLTALLALNVSKQILDAFVAIEENIQRSAITQLDRGDAAKGELKTSMADALSQKTPEMQQKAEKIKRYLSIIELIDKEAAKVIKEIDDTKLMLLEKAGEDVTTIAENDEKAIVWKMYDGRPKKDGGDPLRPARLNLMAVEAKDQFDVPMHELVGADIKVLDESKKGIVIWKLYNDFRKKVVELAGSYQEGEKKYSVKVKDINDWADNKDLDKKVSAMLNGNGNVINKEDVPALMGIYQELTKKEIAKHHETEDVHWIGRTFDHAPMVGALASLSSLQLEVLSARAKAINLLKSKVTTGQFSFNKVVGMAFPSSAVFNPGDEFTMTVFMGAFDSDKQPQVKPDQGTFVEAKNGMATIKLRAPQQGEMKLTGQVGIADKSSDVKWMPYETKIQVGQKAGSISLPDLNVLFTEWDNFMVPVASGIVGEPNLSVTGASMSRATKNGQKGFNVKVGVPNQKVTFSLSGKDAAGNTISFGSFTYKTKKFPDGKCSVTSISKTNNTRLRVSLGQESLFGDIVFNVLGGAVTVGNDIFNFNGDVLPSNLLTKAKPGRDVVVLIDYKRAGGSQRTLKAGLTVRP
ncbi:MAG: hypothetical protein FJY17_06545 [Bacteroidetes bacterium]|nr:hypothetical protein [Bacteroidota bacterium]